MNKPKKEFTAFNRMSHCRSELAQRNVKERVMIDAYHQFPIDIGQLKTYPSNFTWKQLISTKGILDNDRIENIDYKETKRPELFHGTFDEEDENTYFQPMIIVQRHRLETDEEYTTRVKRDTVHTEQEDKKEYDQYIRLKAKFESKGK
jgi:hypothetical protein